MAIAGYTLQCYSPAAYDVGGGWYNYSFWCKASAAASSYTSYRNYALIAYWNGTGWVADAIVSLSLEGMAYNGYGQVWGYSQGQTVHMAAWFYNNYPSTSIGSYVSYQDDWFADAWITLPTVTVNYTVTYNANGATSGSPNPTSQTVSSGATTILGTVGTAVKTGYHADGWAESASGAKTKEFEATYTVTGNKTFYLHWVANTYTVVYNGNGNTGGSTASSSHTYGVAKALTTNGFTRTGFEFRGWSTSVGGSIVYTDGQSVSNLTTENEGTVNLYAVWEDVTEKATYLEEHITNKAYKIIDGTKVHGSGTASRNVNWSPTTSYGYNNISSAPIWSVASAPTTTATNGRVYVTNTSDGKPAQSSWKVGNQVNLQPELAYADLKVEYVSETPDAMTIKIQADSHNTGSYNGGLSDTGWSQNVKVQTPSGTSTLKSISGTWTFWSSAYSYYLRNDCPGKWVDGYQGAVTHTLTKGDTAQSITVTLTETMAQYGTSTATYTFTLPGKDSGCGPAVGHGSTVPHESIVWVKHEGTWKKANMWMKNTSGTWVQARYVKL